VAMQLAVTGNPQGFGSSVGLVPTNAQASGFCLQPSRRHGTNPANFLDTYSGPEVVLGEEMGCMGGAPGRSHTRSRDPVHRLEREELTTFIHWASSAVNALLAGRPLYCCSSHHAAGRPCVGAGSGELRLQGTMAAMAEKQEVRALLAL
jgi:hypothetical protein